MNGTVEAWLLVAGVLSLAALLLWIRDRFRDLRHVPEEERKRSEARNALGASALVKFVSAAAALRFSIASGDPPWVRVGIGLIALVLFVSLWSTLNMYRKIGSKP